MIRVEDIGDAPWGRYNWTGQFVSVDGCPAHDFVVEDVEEVVAHGTTDRSDWDGESAAIVRLKDGRFVAWESDWGPTGSGFCCDAYGGKADIAFAMTKAAALSYLSERGRDLLK